MIADTVVLTALTTVGLVMLYKKLPRKVRKFLEKHDILTDFVTFSLTYIALGSTLTSLVVGVLVAMLTSFIIQVLENKNEYLYIHDFLAWVENGMAELKKTMSEAGAAYRDKKMNNEGVPHAVQAEG